MRLDQRNNVLKQQQRARHHFYLFYVKCHISYNKRAMDMLNSTLHVIRWKCSIITSMVKTLS